METISTARLAHLLGVTSKTIAEWSARGIVCKVSHGKFDLEKSIRGFAAHMRAMADARGGKDAETVKTERARLLRLQADRAALLLETERGLWRRRAEVVGEWNAVFQAIKAGLLAFPIRLAGELPHLSRDDMDIIRCEAEGLLDQLSDPATHTQTIEVHTEADT
jgi:phage terminase Nu1 subunit (DNA packaging protein)